MQKRYLPSTISLLFASAVALNATITLNVKTSGWGNNSSANVNNLAWGIIVDSDGSASGGDFSGSFLADLSSNLNGFTLPGIASFSDPVLVYDEYYFIQSRSLTEAGPPPFSGGYMNDIGINVNSPVETGDDYGLIWFSVDSGTITASDFFGFQDIGVLPAEGGAHSISSTPGLASNAVVPEPSAYAFLAGLLSLGFVFARRK